MFDQDAKNYMLFYSELNVEHDGEGFVSIRLMVLEVLTFKYEKLSISGKN